MKTFMIVFVAFSASIACSMSKKSARLLSPVEPSALHWYMCTEKACGTDYQGKAFLVECVVELNRDGTCKEKKGHPKFKYTVRDIKENHDFFQHMVLVPSQHVY